MFKIFSKLSSRPYDIISGVNTLFGIFFKCIYIYFSLVYRKIGLNFFVLMCFFFYFLTSSFTKRCKLLHLLLNKQLTSLKVIFSFWTIGYYHLPHIIIVKITVNMYRKALTYYWLKIGLEKFGGYQSFSVKIYHIFSN